MHWTRTKAPSPASSPFEPHVKRPPRTQAERELRPRRQVAERVLRRSQRDSERGADKSAMVPKTWSAVSRRARAPHARSSTYPRSARREPARGEAAGPYPAGRSSISPSTGGAFGLRRSSSRTFADLSTLGSPGSARFGHSAGRTPTRCTRRQRGASCGLHESVGDRRGGPAEGRHGVQQAARTCGRQSTNARLFAVRARAFRAALAAVAEIGGAHLVWQGIREGRSSAPRRARSRGLRRRGDHPAGIAVRPSGGGALVAGALLWDPFDGFGPTATTWSTGR